MIFQKIIKKELRLDVVPEYKFHPTRKWRFDFAIPEYKIAIEVEGGAYTNGRHTRGKGFVNDMEKYNEVVCLGWALIRVTPDQLLTFNTIEMIKRVKELKSNEATTN